jgi:hypothetical protein
MRIWLTLAVALPIAAAGCGGPPPTPKPAADESIQMLGIASALQSQIGACISIDKSNGQTPRVRIKIDLNADGTLTAPPTTLEPLDTPEFRAAETAIKSAVVACAPYKLPPNLHDRWRTIVFAFNPVSFQGQ